MGIQSIHTPFSAGLEFAGNTESLIIANQGLDRRGRNHYLECGHASGFIAALEQHLTDHGDQ